MDSIALVARLKDGAEPRARALLADGPPFDPAEHGFSHHAVYLSATEVVFVFGGHGVEWSVDDLVSDPFQWHLEEAFEAWRELVDGPPRIAHAEFVWNRDAT